MQHTLVIYDVDNEEKDILSELDDTIILFSASPMVEDCIGCFGCWLKTPGECIIQERCSVIPKYMSQSEKVIVISPILYGGYSTKIKAIFDRSIGYVLPYFRIVNDEMHHQLRYEKPFALSVCFYGEYDDEEKSIASNLVRANAVNLGVTDYQVQFFDCVDSIRKAML